MDKLCCLSWKMPRLPFLKIMLDFFWGQIPPIFRWNWRPNTDSWKLILKEACAMPAGIVYLWLRREKKSLYRLMDTVHLALTCQLDGRIYGKYFSAECQVRLKWFKLCLQMCKHKFNSGISKHFNGCIKDVVLNSKSVEIDAFEKENVVERCPEWKR